MSNYYSCLRLLNFRKFANKEILNSCLNYRSLTSSSNVLLSNRASFKKSRFHRTFTNPDSNEQFPKVRKGENTCIAASLLNNEGKCAEDTKIENEMLSDIEKGLSELEELANTDIKVVPTVVSSYTDEIAEMDLKGNTTTFTLPRSGNKVYELFGTPDPTEPASNVPCSGCGAKLHCKDSGIPGYLPSQVYLAVPKSQLKECTCQRCQLLKEHQIALDVTVPFDKYNPILNEIKKHTALILLMVDMTDLSNSFHRCFKYLHSYGRPVFVIGNKIDLIQKDEEGYLLRAMNTLKSVVEENGLSQDVEHYAFISAKTGYGVEDLITKMLQSWRLRGHVFLVGCANSGKSTLFNSLLMSDYCRSSAKEVIQRATTSIWPGTTLNLLKFPIINPRPQNLNERSSRLSKNTLSASGETSLEDSKNSESASLHGIIGKSFFTRTEDAILKKSQSGAGFMAPSYNFEENQNGNELVESIGHDGAIEYLNLKVAPYSDKSYRYWCFDTPGLIHSSQIINLLNQEELLECIPQKPMEGRTFSMKPGMTMFVSGLSRIDYCEGNDIMLMTVFVSMDVPINVVDTNEADEFYKKHLGTKTFKIPIGNEERLKSLPPLVGTDFKIEGLGRHGTAVDVVLSSLGWVAVTMQLNKEGLIRAYTPGAAGCKLRNTPLIKHAINFKGSKVKGTSRFRTLKEDELLKKQNQNDYKK